VEHNQDTESLSDIPEETTRPLFSASLTDLYNRLTTLERNVGKIEGPATRFAKAALSLLAVLITLLLTSLLGAALYFLYYQTQQISTARSDISHVQQDLSRIEKRVEELEKSQTYGEKQSSHTQKPTRSPLSTTRP
jgi:cell division protein FtsL